MTFLWTICFLYLDEVALDVEPLEHGCDLGAAAVHHHHIDAELHGTNENIDTLDLHDMYLKGMTTTTPARRVAHLLEKHDVGCELGLQVRVLHGVPAVLDDHSLPPELLDVRLGLCQDLHVGHLADLSQHKGDRALREQTFSSCTISGLLCLGWAILAHRCRRPDHSPGAPCLSLALLGHPLAHPENQSGSTK